MTGKFKRKHNLGCKPQIWDLRDRADLPLSNLPMSKLNGREGGDLAPKDSHQQNVNKTTDKIKNEEEVSTEVRVAVEVEAKVNREAEVKNNERRSPRNCPGLTRKKIKVSLYII